MDTFGAIMLILFTLVWLIIAFLVVCFIVGLALGGVLRRILDAFRRR